MGVYVGAILEPLGVSLGVHLESNSVNLDSIWGSLPGGPSDATFCCYLLEFVGVRAVSL